MKASVKKDMTKSTFFKGTLILLLAGFITRILGFVNRIVHARFVGEEGVGLFMMAAPTLFLVIAATQLGLPVAISKFVAEATADKDHKKVKSILAVSLAVTIVLSLIFTPILFFAAKFLSEHLFTDNRVYYPLLAMTPIIPITAVSAVLRGYFQGKQDMNPFAISQVLEQVVRIALVAFLTKLFLPYGIEYATAGAILAAVIGELISSLYLLARFRFRKNFKLRKNFIGSVFGQRKVFSELMSVAIPTTGSRMIGSIAWFLEPIVVAQSLAIAGLSAASATKLYGELTGFALPLITLPSFITISLSTSLIPALSEAYSRNNIRKVEYQLYQSLRFTFLSGVISLVIIYVLADPLMTLMYGHANSAHYIRTLAPFFLFFFYQGPLQAAMQAMNMAGAAMMNSFIGALVKTVLIFALATRPDFGIKGVTIALGVGTVLVTLLHFISISRKIRIPFFLKEYVLTGIIMTITGYTGHLLFSRTFSDFGLPLSVNLLLTMTIMLLLFLILLILMGVLNKAEVERIPFIGKPLSWMLLK